MEKYKDNQLNQNNDKINTKNYYKNYVFFRYNPQITQQQTFAEV